MLPRRLFLLCLCLPAIQASAAGDDAFWSQLRQGGNIVLLRHAQTVPGIGDPPGYTLGDCASQRNLSAAGRADAARIGAQFRRRGIAVDEVLSSRWCRCVDTAKIAFGKVRTASMLDSMFHDTRRSDADKLRELDAHLARRPANGANLVLVTHAQNISILTGESAVSGEMLVVRRTGPGQLQVLQRARP